MSIAIPATNHRYSQPLSIFGLTPILYEYGLVAAITGISGIPYDIVNRKTLTAFGGAKLSEDLKGIALNTTSANSAFEDTSTTVTPQEISIYWVGAYKGTPTPDGGICGITYSNDSSESPYVAASIKYAASTSKLLFAYNNNGAPAAIEIDEALSTIKTSLCVTHKSGEQVFYKDGIKKGNTSVSANILYGTGPRLFIGEDYRLLSRNSNVRTDIMLVFNKAIPPSFIRWLDEMALWQIFEPGRTFFYINSELMLTLQGLTQAQNLETPQLTQQNILSTLGISQSQNLGTADLTQQNTLSPAEIIQIQSLSGVPLIQQNSISLAGLTQAQTLGAVELIQQNILNPTGLSQAQILDAFDLTVAGGAASSITVFSRPNTAQGVLEGPIIPKLNSDFSDMELCLLGGRKEGVGGPIRDFSFYGDCGFQTGRLGDGQGPTNNTNDGAITFENSEALQAGTLSGVAVFEYESLVNLQTIFSTIFSGTGLNYGLYVHIGATGTVRLSTTIANLVIISGKFSAGKPAIVAWSYNKSTGLAQLWVNGTYNSATNVKDTSSEYSTGSIGGFGAGQEGFGYGKKIFYLCAVWGRGMTPAELMTLGENPWQIFQPERKVFFLPQSELSLAPQGLSNTQQLGQPALTQQSSLSVNGAAQAQELDAPSITQQSTISPSTLAQAQVLGVISLVSQNTLAMNGLAQSQTISAIALTQQGALAITNLAQGQTLDGISLAQQNLLSVAGANSAQNVSSPTLAFGAFLSVGSAQQVQTLGTLSLVQQNILVVNGISSSQSLGSIALQQANVLSVQGQVQSQSLGVLELVFQAYLAPNSITSSQTIESLSLTQANILEVYGLSQGQSLENIDLSQEIWLIVDDVLHQQIAANIHLLDGAAVIRVAGSIVYVLGSKAPVFVLNSSAKILVTAG